MNPEHLAQHAYTLYCERVGGYAFNGDKLPTWEEFSKDLSKAKQASAWRVVGQFIADHANSEVKASKYVP